MQLVGDGLQPKVRARRRRSGCWPRAGGGGASQLGAGPWVTGMPGAELVYCDGLLVNVALLRGAVQIRETGETAPHVWLT